MVIFSDISSCNNEFSISSHFWDWFKLILLLSAKVKVVVYSPDSMTTHVQQTLPFPWQGGRQCSLQLLIQPWICALGTHYSWVDRCCVEYEACPTCLHRANTGNRTQDLLILKRLRRGKTAM